MTVKSAQAVTVLFSTANATTGAAADATGAPTGTLYVDGTANGAAVTVTNITTGVYKAAVTLPALTAGQIVSLRIAATVATIAAEGVVWQDVADTSLNSDVKTDTAAILLDTGTDGVVVAPASKTGYALSATGLDSIPVTAPAGVASTFREMVVQLWRRFFKKTTMTATQVKTYADDGATVVTTQTVSDDSTTQTQGAAT